VSCLANRRPFIDWPLAAGDGNVAHSPVGDFCYCERDERLPISALISLVALAAQLQALQTLIGSIENRIVAQRRANEASKRPRTFPGAGIIGATAITALVTIDGREWHRLPFTDGLFRHHRAAQLRRESEHTLRARTARSKISVTTVGLPGPATI
jgi:hypothetical protein